MKQIRNVLNIIRVDPKNNNTEMNLKNIIIPYSLIKIKANNPPPYSMLNPETISDSPSAISKGVRLDSAIQIIIQHRSKGIENTPIHMFSCIIIIIFMLYDLLI